MLNGIVQMRPDSLDSHRFDWSQTITVDFKIKSFAVSGLQVDEVKILNEAYKPFKGIHYMTRAGKYQFRT